MRTLATGALVLLAVAGASTPSVAHAKPKIDPNIEMDCFLDGEWYDAGTQLVNIYCNGFDGEWHSVRVSTGDSNLFNSSASGTLKTQGP